jgi:hypothetical protein
VLTEKRQPLQVVSTAFFIFYCIRVATGSVSLSMERTTARYSANQTDSEVMWEIAFSWNFLDY